MGNRIWFAVVIAAFAAGFGTHAFISAPDSTLITHAQLQSSFSSSSQSSSEKEHILSAADIEFPEESSQSSSLQKRAASASSGTQSSQGHTSSSSSLTANANLATESSSAASTAPNQLSDEEINQKIPKPFNESFKKAHPSLKEKYKDFLDTDHHRKDDWDLRMQGLLTDFVLSRPSATDITIESLSCNANMCELRLFEQKKFLLLGLFGELMQQPWLSNQVNGSVDFNPDTSSCYILMMRKTQ